jgi:hypothetical protein
MRKLQLAFFFFCYSFFIFFASGVIDSQDGFAYLAVARRAYFDHTFEMPPGKWPHDNLHFSTAVNAKGEIFSPTGLGFTLAYLPAVLAEDISLRIANVEPFLYFPLQADWPVLLFASWTNSFFGALLALFLYQYFRTFELSHKYSMIAAFLSVVASNLFPYTKHAFAHMMFASFLMGAFLMVRKYGLSSKARYLFGAGALFGLMAISYNPTFVLPALPLFVYWLSFVLPIRTLKQFTERITHTIFGVLGLLPFVALNWWFNNIRFGVGLNSGYVPTKGGSLLPELYVFVDGIWNLLFSSGKSIFFFSPLLLVPILFWHKFRKEWRREFIAFILLSIIYILFIGTLTGGYDYLLWHGESSWGPRYVTPILPGMMLLAFLLISRISNKARLFVITPLILLGISVQLAGMLLPYQIRFAGLQIDNYMNGRNFVVYEYGNVIPRYAPWFTMSKFVAKHLVTLPRYLYHGKYNVRLQEGFDAVFVANGAKWRGMRQRSYITFESSSKNPAQKLSLQLRNHTMNKVASESATMKVWVNGGEPIEKVFAVGEEGIWEVPFTPQDKNRVDIEYNYKNTPEDVVRELKQIIFLQAFRINDIAQPIQTMDYPFVSPVSKSLLKLEYPFYDSNYANKWNVWHHHSSVYEQTLDIWWMRPLHYWDLPKKFFLALLAGNVAVFAGTGLYLKKKLKQK